MSNYTRLNSQMKILRESPTGSTAKAKVENAVKDVMYSWSDYNAGDYSPTGAAGNWAFEAFKEGDYWTFNYNGNAWVQH